MRTRQAFSQLQDISAAIYSLGYHDVTLQNGDDQSSKKIKFLLTLSVGIFDTLSFDKKFFFNTLLGLTPF